MDKVEEARLKYLADKEVGNVIIDISDTYIVRIPDWVPDEIARSFYCNDCPNLSSLEGVPKIVGGYFDCSNCESLSSLEGAPDFVEGYFDCHSCDNVSSPEGMGDVKGRFFSDFMTNNEFQAWRRTKKLNKQALDSLDDALKDAGDILSTGI